MWKERRERNRCRMVGFRGLACEVNVKFVEGFGAREGLEVVIVLLVIGRRFMEGFGRWKADRIGARSAPRAPERVVRSMVAKGTEVARSWY